MLFNHLSKKYGVTFPVKSEKAKKKRKTTTKKKTTTTKKKKKKTKKQKKKNTQQGKKTDQGSESPTQVADTRAKSKKTSKKQKKATKKKKAKVAAEVAALPSSGTEASGEADELPPIVANPERGRKRGDSSEESEAPENRTPVANTAAKSKKRTKKQKMKKTTTKGREGLMHTLIAATDQPPMPSPRKTRATKPRKKKSKRYML